jgi:hypothetical protein
MGPAAEIILVDTDHSGLNKCSRREDELYVELKRAMESLRPYVVISRFHKTSELTNNLEPESLR